MASIKNLKKNINYTLGDIIGECYEWNALNPEGDVKKSEAIVDEAVAVFDELVVKLHDKTVENKKQHFKAISADLENKSKALNEKIKSL